MLKNKCILLLATALVAVSAAFVSCGSSKSAVDGRTSATGMNAAVQNPAAARRDFLRKVYDNEVYAKNIASKIKFTVSTGSKDLSVAGSLSMKKDEVIRIQLTPFGLMEVGRLEFTKDYVLLMDRINKEYVKASYADVSFLKDNGLDFFTLQALFWNQLFVPGTQKITDSSLKNFSVTFNDAVPEVIVSLKRGDLDYRWGTDKTSGRIRSVDVAYSGKTSGNTTVTCNYGSFKPLGSKQFPTDITLMMKSDAVKGGKTFALNMSFGDIDTGGDWETYTTVSGKYRQVSAQDLKKRLLKL